MGVHVEHGHLGNKRLQDSQSSLTSQPRQIYEFRFNQRLIDLCGLYMRPYTFGRITQANVDTPTLASEDVTRTKQKKEEEEEDDNETSIKSHRLSLWRPRAVFLPYSSCPHQIRIQAPSSTANISKLTTLKSM